MPTYFNRKVVYTAIFGGTDTLQEPSFPKSDDTEYVCFTDNRKIVSNFWKIVHLEDGDFPKAMDVVRRPLQGVLYRPAKATLKNRELKFFPESFIEDAIASAYMDGHVRLKSCLSPLLDQELMSHEWCSPAHRYGGNTLIEALRCYDADKITRDELRAFFEEILPISIPKHTPFPENGLILRRHSSNDVTLMSDRWWKRFAMGPFRDQLHWQTAFIGTELRFKLLPYRLNEQNRYYSLGQHNNAKIKFLKAKLKYFTRKSFF